MKLNHIIKKSNLVYVFFISIGIAFTSCSGDNGATPTTENTSPAKTETASAVPTDPLLNKGIGPVKHVDLKDELVDVYVTRGENIFNSKCSACHKFDEKYVGPKMGGITERRSPEWIMNMILNPEEMIKKDPIAQELLAEHLTQMTFQDVTEDEARYMLEYFRSYDQNN